LALPQSDAVSASPSIAPATSRLSEDHGGLDGPAPATGRTRRRGITRRLSIALVASAAITVIGALPASAAWPVATRSSYVSQYAHRGHVAIDIAAHAWTRIVPIRSGRVVFAGWKSNCGGYQVWVSHGNGLYSAYYHMSRENSYRGEWVTGGRETIGWVGSTGCATGPHLHVEVWRGYPWRSGSYRVNPWGFIDNGSYLPYRYR
jgi:murein DD-endopeptidase MepM/ murein hydrolase activator NlpD